MLTEIEWWGGIVFIAMAFSLTLFISAARENGHYDVGTIAGFVMFICASVTLALYFYELQSQMVQLLYVSSLGVGVITTLLVFFWPEKDIDAAEEDKEKDDDADEEEASMAMELIGQAIFVFPVLVSLALAGIKVLSFDLQALFT